MIKEKQTKTEYHKNNTLFFITEIAIIEPMFLHLYPQRLKNENDEDFIKLKCEKYFDNGQFAWSLIWNEDGELLNKSQPSYRKDGTIIQT